MFHTSLPRAAPNVNMACSTGLVGRLCETRPIERQTTRGVEGTHTVTGPHTLAQQHGLIPGWNSHEGVLFAAKVGTVTRIQPQCCRIAVA